MPGRSLERRTVKEVGGEPAIAECYCTKLKCVCKQLIINEIVVEAAGVELFSVLIIRNLLILGTATTAKKAPLPDPLYVYCTKTLSLWSPTDTARRPQYRIDSQRVTPLSISSVRWLAVSITSGLPVMRQESRPSDEITLY
jgi:hypothetical protein